MCRLELILQRSERRESSSVVFGFFWFFLPEFFGGPECVLVRLLHTTPRRFVIARVRASRKLESYKEVAAVALLFFYCEWNYYFFFGCTEIILEWKRWRKEINHFFGSAYLCLSVNFFFFSNVHRDVGKEIIFYSISVYSFSRGVISIAGLDLAV